MDDLGALVLCGGRSTRMGRPKALLPFGDELLIERVIRRVAPAVSAIAVVAAPGQALPPLPPEVIVARDPIEGEGPLCAIAAGLAALHRRVRFAYVTATDAPLIAPAFVRRMRALCDGEAAVPEVGGRLHPLAAVYATALHAAAQELFDAGERRATALCDRARVVTAAEIAADPAVRAEDPELATLRNLNTPDDYHAALAAAGL